MTAPETASIAPTRIAAVTRGSLMFIIIVWDCGSPLPKTVLIISDMGTFREPTLTAKTAITTVAKIAITNTSLFRLKKALYDWS
jgi:hypothetical protein